MRCRTVITLFTAGSQLGSVPVTFGIGVPLREPERHPA
jgi:hypothetical protein